MFLTVSGLLWLSPGHLRLYHRVHGVLQLKKLVSKMFENVSVNKPDIRKKYWHFHLKGKKKKKKIAKTTEESFLPHVNGLFTIMFLTISGNFQPSPYAQCLEDLETDLGNARNTSETLGNKSETSLKNLCKYTGYKGVIMTFCLKRKIKENWNSWKVNYAPTFLVIYIYVFNSFLQSPAVFSYFRPYQRVQATF